MSASRTLPHRRPDHRDRCLVGIGELRCRPFGRLPDHQGGEHPADRSRLQVLEGRVAVEGANRRHGREGLTEQRGELLVRCDERRRPVDRADHVVGADVATDDGLVHDRRPTDDDLEATRPRPASRARDVPDGEGAPVERTVTARSRRGRQVDLGESLQLLVGAGHGGLDVTHVDLDDLGPGTVAGVGHVTRHRDVGATPPRGRCRTTRRSCRSRLRRTGSGRALRRCRGSGSRRGGLRGTRPAGVPGKFRSAGSCPTCSGCSRPDGRRAPRRRTARRRRRPPAWPPSQHSSSASTRSAHGRWTTPPLFSTTTTGVARGGQRLDQADLSVGEVEAGPVEALGLRRRRAAREQHDHVGRRRRSDRLVEQLGSRVAPVVAS
jgi:hypothetical protein